MDDETTLFLIAVSATSPASRIVKLCERLSAKGFAGRKIADQLFDSGTSMGANTAESQGGQTKPDFIAKLAIARKRKAGNRSTGYSSRLRQT